MFKVLFYLSTSSIPILARSKLFLEMNQTDMKHWTDIPSKPQDLPFPVFLEKKPTKSNATKTKSSKPDTELKRDFIFHKGLFLGGMKNQKLDF